MNQSDHSSEAPAEGAARPQGAARTAQRARIAANFSTIGLFVLAIMVVLYHTGDFMIPVVGAILLNLILSPAVRGLHRLRIPYPVASAIILVGTIGLIGGGFYGLSDPVTKWLSDIPEAVTKFEQQTLQFREPLEQVREASSRVENITGDGEAEEAPETVVVREPDLATRLFGSITDMLLQMGLMLVLLYFLLAVGDLFQSKLIRLAPRLKDKLRAQQIAAQVVHDISIYLATITVINAMMGAAVAVALFFLGLPNPALWGVMAALLNFVPYLGGVAGVSIVFIASLITFDTLPAALLPPLAYAAINALEGQFITPSIVSRSLTLNPVVVFLSVSFWAWFWGIPGALMAVPILVILKILGDRLEALAPLGEFLGGRPGKVPLPDAGAAKHHAE